MCDGTSSGLSTAEKLELLTAHADAWQRLDTACPEKADILVGWGAPIAVSYNIMVFSRRSRQPESHEGKWNDEDPEVMALMGPRLNLLVVRVPSALRRVEAAHWVLDLPGNVDEVCIDASQDLLIYLTSYVIFFDFASFFVENETDHVRVGFGALLFRDGIFYPCTLSSQASHPLAERGRYFGMWGDDAHWRIDVSNLFDLCVCGDFVAGVTRVFFISVWNWKTGELVFDQVRISD
jgi:hypothetical protein